MQMPKVRWVFNGIFRTTPTSTLPLNRWIGILILSGLLFGCSGATRLAFVPMKSLLQTPDRLNLEWEPVDHLSLDHKTRLYSWWLPASTKETKGSVLFLHGNAENISTHIHSVRWLPEAGYNVFLLGYRGFGPSEGSPQLPDILKDIESAARWINIRTPDTPFFVLGQSMGAALAVNFTAAHGKTYGVQGLAIDACFRGLPNMALTTLSRSVITWILVPVGWAIMPSDYDPEDLIAKISPTPLLMFHSQNDQVIPYQQGRDLFERAKAPKYWAEAKGRHIQTFEDKDAQHALLTFLRDREI